MSHATHANAALTPPARLKPARLIVDHDWKPALAAERYDASWRTAKKWADRYAAEGPAGMVDRSSAPHHQPNWTPAPVVGKIVHLRWKQRLGPVPIADRLGMQASTVHAVLVRCRLNRPTHVDRATGEPVRRYEHEHPGDLIHVDVKKLGKVPDGGGWRYVGRQQGDKNVLRQQRGLDHAARATIRASGPATYTPSSTTTPGSPTSRLVTTKPGDRQRGPAQRGRLVRSPAASRSIGCSATTAAASVEPLAPVVTTPSQRASPLCQHGSPSTTTTGRTQQ